MLRNQHHEYNLIFACETDGKIVSVLSDVKQLFHKGEVPDVASLFVGASFFRYQKFIENINLMGFALCEKMPFMHSENELVFSFFGIYKSPHIYVVGVQSPQHFFVIYEEFMHMINEQARDLRVAQKEAHRAKIEQKNEGNTVEILEEYMQLNNEMANIQRQLVISNNLLRTQEKRFRDLVSCTPDAQLVLDGNNRILFANPAVEKLIGKPSSQLLHTPCPFPASATEEVCFSTPERHICVDVRSNQIVWEGHQALLLSLRDITEQLQIEQVKQDVQRITQHDLISPLNPVINIPEMLLEDDNITEEQKMLLSQVKKAGKRLLHMIRLSLNLYKMEQGTFEYLPNPVDLLSTFADIVADQSSTILSKNIQISFEKDGVPFSSGDTFWVAGEEMLCYSLFSNLVLNSLEATHAGHAVTIKLSRGDTMHCISVHNDEVVPEEIRSSFFKKYVTHGKNRGTGLGTYSAKLIATTLGGSIDMTSSAEHGTTVSVMLPAFDDS